MRWALRCLCCSTAAYVAAAHDWLKASGKECGVSELGEVQTKGSVSSLLVGDPDNNWWEVTSPN